jgi:predicted enzyme related to lactoylglutathione lyase
MAEKGEEPVGKRESYEPGTFSWVDLSTPNAEGAKAFYSGLFGWEFRDDDIPGGGVYTMCFREGDAVGAIVQQDEQPAHWNNYVSVESADETAARAKDLGATLFEDPFDVMDFGRMAVFADPRRRHALRLGAKESYRRGEGQRPRLHELERSPDPRSRSGR